MFDVVLHDYFYLLVEYSLHLVEEHHQNVEEDVQAESEQKTLFFAVVGEEEGVDAQLESVDHDYAQSVEGQQGLVLVYEANQHPYKYEYDQTGSGHQ